MSGFRDEAFNQSIVDTILSDIISKVIDCCKLMVEDYLEKGVGIANNEEVIRNVLRESYLNDNDVRTKVGLRNYYFMSEVPVTYIDDVSKRRADIKVISRQTLADTGEYFIFECKRIDGARALNKAYLEEGVERFIGGGQHVYPSPMGRSCMFGFVVKELDIQRNTDKVNELQKEIYIEVDETNLLTKSSLIESFPFIYESSHDLEESALRLYHLFYRFSEIIVKNT